MHIPRRFSKIGLFGRTFNDNIVQTLRALIAHLEEQSYLVVIEEKTAQALDLSKEITFSSRSIPNDIDLILVVGGDGSMLDAAHRIVDHGIPLLGVNRGNLGFLTDVYPDALESQLSQVLSGDYAIEERFMLNTGEYNALNEFTITTQESPQLIGFEIYVDQKLMCHQRSDGLIIATPTGSTAYALSGGGPILHPSLNAIVLVPMFPHTLSMRPIVISGDSVITIKVSNPIRVSADSQRHFTLDKDQTLTIKKKNMHVKLVHPLSYDYYQSLRSKLHWGLNVTTPIH